MFKIISLILLSTFLFSQSEVDLYEKLTKEIKSKNLNEVKALINSGINLNFAPKGKSHILTVAVYSKSYELVKLLVKNGAKLNLMTGGFESTPIMHAAYNNDIKMVDLLESLGANINQRDGSYGDPAINWAAYAGHREMVNHLLKKGASPYFVGHGNALEIVMRRGFEDLVHDLSDFMKVTRELSPKLEKLYKSVIAKNSHEVNKMLESGVNPNSLGLYGRPLIHSSARLGDLKSLKSLHAYGADLNRIDRIGFTALFYACLNDKADVVEYLLNNGAEVNLRANDRALNLTPMHLAAIGASKKSVQLLFDHGANLNVKGSTDTTPLLWGLFEGSDKHIEVAVQLIEAGADPTIATKNGYDAVKHADAIKNKKLISAIDRWKETKK